MKKLSTYLSPILNSYSVVFFSQNKLFGFILLAVTFVHPIGGLAALLAVVLALLLVDFTGFNKEVSAQGLYSFNAMLTALGLAHMYQLSGYFWFILALATMATVILSIILSGWLGKYGLPFLSLPFIFTFWMISLADHHLIKNSSNNDPEFWNTTTQYIGNHIPTLTKVTQTNQSGLDTNQIARDTTIQNAIATTLQETATATQNATVTAANLSLTFLKSLSAILFQDNAITGFLIAIAFLLYSRIGFSLLVLGFAAAYGFEILSGETASSINYYNFGANYMMTAVAIGAFFIIASKRSYLWAIAGVFFCGIMVKGLSRALNIWELPIFSLPFSMVVIVMLYFFMQRISIKKLHLTVIQNYSPELNLYQFINNQSRVNSLQYIPLSLPFMGDWTVSQGYDGDITHKGDWAKALDFVMTDQDGQTYTNGGTQLKDFYCYNKPVLACADGFVEDLADDIEDNAIGEADTANNWGNSIVIRHRLGLYSKVSHLKKGSLKVKRGDFVYRGDILAACGNSGRSPEPHLHFQVQATPYIGSKTLAYPIGNYLALKEGSSAFESYTVPVHGSVVCNAEFDTMLKKAFAFQPGYRIAFTDTTTQKTEEWEVFTDAYNLSYIYSKSGNATAYFSGNGMSFCFTNFYGDKNSLLYQFYLAAYHVVLSTAEGLITHDVYPLSHSKFKQLLWLQDFTAPFYRFISLNYQSQVEPTERADLIRILAQQQLKYPGHQKQLMTASISIADGLIKSFTTHRGSKITEAICTTV